MVTIIFLSFFVYNRMAAEQDAYILAFRESIQKTKDAGTAHLLGRVAAQTDRTYIGPEKPAFSAEEAGDSYTVTAKDRQAYSSEKMPAVVRSRIANTLGHQLLKKCPGLLRCIKTDGSETYVVEFAFRTLDGKP